MKLAIGTQAQPAKSAAQLTTMLQKYIIFVTNHRRNSFINNSAKRCFCASPNKSAENLKQLSVSFENQKKRGGIVPLYQQSLLYGNRIAIKDNFAEYRYIDLYAGAKLLANHIALACNGIGTSNKVAFLCSNSAVYILVQWACWIAGQIAVPLNPQYPLNLLQYLITDSEACLLITVPEFEEKFSNLAKSLGLPLSVVDHSFIPVTANSECYLNADSKFVTIQTDRTIAPNERLKSDFYAKANAMILYTSGSTGRPKGSLITHRNLSAQAKCLTSTWYINHTDTLLHCAPLSHALGSIHTLACPLAVGARIIMLPKFDATQVWHTLLDQNSQIDIFMAVPTMFRKLIDEYDRRFAKDVSRRKYLRQHCRDRIRVMVAGSAPLPQIVYDKWYQITGHKLLLRYGTTEIGMALSNSYVTDSVRQRSSQSVGRPMPGCEVKLVDNGRDVIQMSGEYDKEFWSRDDMSPIRFRETVTGEIYVRGPNVFSEYYKRPDATKSSFDDDGWFKTGDYAKYENGVFSILGRTSVDIIKTGGFKVSALEVETQLLEHSAIVDVCVVGVPDDVWGQIVGAVVVLDDNGDSSFDAIQQWCKGCLATYQIPKRWQKVVQLKRNEMGKVNKAEVLKEHFLSK